MQGEDRGPPASARPAVLRTAREKITYNAPDSTIAAARVSTHAITDRAAPIRSNTREYTFEHKSLAASFLKLLEH
jgi:hypothetical protein